MRIIVILVLFSVIAYASSSAIIRFKTNAVKSPKEKEILIKDRSPAMAINFGKLRDGCDFNECMTYCSSIMDPPFIAVCIGDYCVCEEL
ncbi:unnamed protein product [Chironomus riparius]|uniref:Uncharacterized protein n=1 Tax=Chironomus riparius TaxID=315576 RepID=A0A9N9WSA0_9DIPT|nr:unnamed protein product [Chironomus riparius]